MSLYDKSDNTSDFKFQANNKFQSPIEINRPPTRSYGHTKDVRPPVPVDPPTLIRIYKSTAQRVKLSISSLRSDAVFLLICDEDKQVIAWFGSESSTEDREFSLKVGLEVAVKDYGNVEMEEIPVILEDIERTVQLRYFLDKLWEDEATYRSSHSRDQRRHVVINSPVTVNIIEKIVGGNYLMKELKRTIPDENGTVHRVVFPPVDKDTIVAISFGDQWDLWVARGSLHDLDNIQQFLANYISALSESEFSISGWTGGDYSQNIYTVKQGCERRLFRLPLKLLTNFEPPGKTIPYSVFSAYDKQYEGTKDKLRGIEDSTENSELDENGSPYEGFNDGNHDYGYDEDGNPYDEAFNDSNYPDENVYQEDGIYANENGYYPDENGYYPDENGYYPDENGYYPDENGYYPDENGYYPGDQNNLDDQGYDMNSLSSSTLKKVTFDDGYSSVQDNILTEPNPMAAHLPPSADLTARINFESYDDLPQPSILAEFRDRKKNPGKYLLNQESVNFREDENIGPEVRMELLELSIHNPKILVGWQIEIDEGTYSGVRVITGTRKTLFAKTEYRLSRRNYDSRVDPYSSAFDDSWVRLKRLRLKGGFSFRPLRQVLSIDDSKPLNVLSAPKKDTVQQAIEIPLGKQI